MFIYQNSVYLKPMYTVQAYRKEELPEAFSQLEKLRHSGYLTGYFRRAAIYPDEHMIPEEPDTPLLKFFLFRVCSKQEENAAGSQKQVFCPAIRPLHNSLHQLYAVAGTKDTPYARDLATRCQGKDIFAMLEPSFSTGGYYQDAFEEVLALCDHQIVGLDLKDEQDHARANSMTVEELLKSSFGRDEVLGIGCLSRDSIVFHGADCLMVRARQDDVFCCVMKPGDADPQGSMRRLCLPQGTEISACTRLENEAVFLLREHLDRIKKLGQDHGIDVSAIDAMGMAVNPAGPMPLPGDLADFKVSLENAWYRLPDSWKEELEKQGTDLSAGPLALSIVLDTEGKLTVTAKPLPERAPVLGYVRLALDERTDLVPLSLTTPLPCEDGVKKHLADGTWQDAVVVNRFAVATACTESELAFRQGSKLLTPPDDAGMRNDVLRSILLKKHVLEERGASLPQVLSSEALYCVSSVIGARRVEKADPAAI